MALVLSGSIDISGSMTATTIVVSAPGVAGMVSSSAQITELAPLMAYTSSLKGAAIVSSSQQITNYYKFAETASANTFYGNQSITGGSLRMYENTNTNYWDVYTYTDNTLRLNYKGAGNDEIVLYNDGNLSLEAAITASNFKIKTAGGGIDFSITSNGSGTTTSELLNDYETGTWTAALICGTSGTITLKVAPSSCMYTKIGRLVNVSGYIEVQSVSSPTGRLRITGFPFTQISDGVPVGVGYLNNTNAYTGFAIMLGNESDGAYIDRNAGTGADAALDMSSAIKANSEIYFNLTYTTT